MITAISRVTLYVNNQKEANVFWVEKMGFQVIFEQAMAERTWLEVAPTKEGTCFVLYEKEHQQQNSYVDCHPSLILSTKHIDKTYLT